MRLGRLLASLALWWIALALGWLAEWVSPAEIEGDDMAKIGGSGDRESGPVKLAPLCPLCDSQVFPEAMALDPSLRVVHPWCLDGDDPEDAA